MRSMDDGGKDGETTGWLEYSLASSRSGRVWKRTVRNGSEEEVGVRSGQSRDGPDDIFDRSYGFLRNRGCGQIYRAIA